MIWANKKPLCTLANSVEASLNDDNICPMKFAGVDKHSCPKIVTLSNGSSMEELKKIYHEMIDPMDSSSSNVL